MPCVSGGIRCRPTSGTRSGSRCTAAPAVTKIPLFVIVCALTVNIEYATPRGRVRNDRTVVVGAPAERKAGAMTPRQVGARPHSRDSRTGARDSGTWGTGHYRESGHPTGGTVGSEGAGGHAA